LLKLAHKVYFLIENEMKTFLIKPAQLGFTHDYIIKVLVPPKMICPLSSKEFLISRDLNR
jgi:hypothetical protein